MFAPQPCQLLQAVLQVSFSPLQQVAQAPFVTLDPVQLLLVPTRSALQALALLLRTEEQLRVCGRRRRGGVRGGRWGLGEGAEPAGGLGGDSPLFSWLLHPQTESFSCSIVIRQDIIFHFYQKTNSGVSASVGLGQEPGLGREPGPGLRTHRLISLQLPAHLLDDSDEETQVIRHFQPTHSQ